jgi:hypothetical protein
VIVQAVFTGNRNGIGKNPAPADTTGIVMVANPVAEIVSSPLVGVARYPKNTPINCVKLPAPGAGIVNVAVALAPLVLLAVAVPRLPAAICVRLPTPDPSGARVTDTLSAAGFAPKPLGNLPSIRCKAAISLILKNS